MFMERRENYLCDIVLMEMTIKQPFGYCQTFEQVNWVILHSRNHLFNLGLNSQCLCTEQANEEYMGWYHMALQMMYYAKELDESSKKHQPDQREHQIQPTICQVCQVYVSSVGKASELGLLEWEELSLMLLRGLTPLVVSSHTPQKQKTTCYIPFLSRPVTCSKLSESHSLDRLQMRKVLNHLSMLHGHCAKPTLYGSAYLARVKIEAHLKPWKEFDEQRALDEEAESTRHETLANRKNGYQEEESVEARGTQPLLKAMTLLHSIILIRSGTMKIYGKKLSSQKLSNKDDNFNVFMDMGMGPGGPYGDDDPNNPFGTPSQPPGFWISLIRVMSGFVTFLGRVAMLIDQNAQAFHVFMSALLQKILDNGQFKAMTVTCIRGSQAYSNGDLAKAEDCYTQGLNSVSQNEKSRSCLKALMLCHSNLATTMISLGRMKEALGDCPCGLLCQYLMVPGRDSDTFRREAS
ncbi:peroxisomal membrane protein 13 [Artemisia annua]|uniref:Peroxisomal membrane protein 13 n=1 Tax=Artemisia annua TaxID=35608 RepID=A0A2U1KP80_ARTAN|nr:peroxisomal membrane protein 13 [Artemisia annua]